MSHCRAFVWPLPLLFLASCAGSGSYPSLAQRPIERSLGAPDVEPVVTPVADDPAVAQHIATLVAEARHGQVAFDAALPAARAAVKQAGAPGSETWTAAQQAVSRAETAEASTTRSLAELDRYSADQANAKALSPGDLDRLQSAVADVQRLADAQHRAVVHLQDALRAP